MAQQYATDEAGYVFPIDAQGNPIGPAISGPGMGAAQEPGVIAPDPRQVRKRDLETQSIQQRLNDALRNAPLETAIKEQQLQDARNPRAAPPSGYRYTADGKSLEQIPGGPRPKNVNSGMLDVLVNQVNESNRLYGQGPATTSGFGGIRDFAPAAISDANATFDVAANQLEDQAALAFKTPGGGAQTDADAKRIAAANKPSRWLRDSANEQLFKGLRQRIDAMRAAQGLPPAKWNFDENGKPVQEEDALLASGGGGTASNPPSPPSGYNGPPGLDVAGVAGGVSGGPGGGGAGFANAAGVAMSQKLAQAYNQGATLPQLNSLLTENGFQPFTNPEAITQIQRRGPLNFAPPEVDDTRGAFGRAMGSAVDGGFAGDVGAYAASATNAATGNNLDSIVGGQAGLALDYASENSPTASLLGAVTGSGLAAAGAELGLGAAAARAGIGASPWIARGADALYGAVSGAGAADDPGDSRWAGAALGGGLGLGGGIAGRAAARGIGGALTGVRSPDIQALRGAGIPLTAGQALGGMPRRIENAMTSIPGVGDVIGNRYREGVAALRPAAVREAVGGVPGNITATSGREAIEQGRAAVGDAYDSALGGVNLQVDPAYRRDLGAALQGANSLPGPLRDTFTSTMQNRVAPQFNGQAIDGRGLQAAVQGLRRDSGDLIRRNEIQSDLFADRATDVEEALFNLAERQAPGTPEALQAANRANRGLSIVEEASARAMNNGGDFSAAQLGQSIRQNSRRFNGMRALNSGKAPLQALQEAAQNVLPSVVPDSGTTGRALVAGGAGLLGAGTLGGGAGYTAGGAEGATTGAGAGLALAALLAAGGSKTSQKALTGLLTSRPDALVKMGDKIGRASRYGGIFGAPLLPAGMYLAGQ